MAKKTNKSIAKAIRETEKTIKSVDRWLKNPNNWKAGTFKK